MAACWSYFFRFGHFVLALPGSGNGAWVKGGVYGRKKRPFPTDLRIRTLFNGRDTLLFVRTNLRENRVSRLTIIAMEPKWAPLVFPLLLAVNLVKIKPESLILLFVYGQDSVREN
jgi:hypothetical protein